MGRVGRRCALRCAWDLGGGAVGPLAWRLLRDSIMQICLSSTGMLLQPSKTGLTANRVCLNQFCSQRGVRQARASRIATRRPIRMGC